MADLGPEWLTIILFGTLVILLLAGLPLVFALGGVATLFTIFIWGPSALAVLANSTYTCMNMFMLVAVPMGWSVGGRPMPTASLGMRGPSSPHAGLVSIG